MMLFKLNSLRLCQIKYSTILSRSTSNTTPSFEESLFNGLINNKRSDLARSITLVETTNPEKKKKSQKLMKLVLENLKEKRVANEKPCIRIGYFFHCFYSYIF